MTVRIGGDGAKGGCPVARASRVRDADRARPDSIEYTAATMTIRVTVVEYR